MVVQEFSIKCTELSSTEDLNTNLWNIYDCKDQALGGFLISDSVSAALNEGIISDELNICKKEGV